MTAETPMTREGGSYEEMPDGTLRRLAGTAPGNGARAADGTPLDRPAAAAEPVRRRRRHAGRVLSARSAPSPPPPPAGVPHEERAAGATVPEA